MDIIKDPTMDYQQRCIALAKYAENLEDHIVLSDRTKYFQEKQVVTAMGEGASPYRPRYVTMDFEKFFASGKQISGAGTAEGHLGGGIRSDDHLPPYPRRDHAAGVYRSFGSPAGALLYDL